MAKKIIYTGTNAMKYIAVSIVGRIFNSFLMKLVLYFAIFFLWKLRATKK